MNLRRPHYEFLAATAFGLAMSLREWERVLGPYNTLAMPFEPTAADGLLASLTALLLAGLAWGGFRLASRGSSHRSALIHGLLLALLALPLLHARHLLGTPTLGRLHQQVLGVPHFGALALLTLGLLGGALAIRSFLLKPHTQRYFTAALTLALPFLIFHFGRFQWRVWTSPPVPGASTPVAPRLPRVVILVFDELDASWVERGKTAGLLPHFSRLHRESVSAERAYAPARQTLASFSSYLLGEKVASFCPGPWGQLAYTTEGSHTPRLLRDSVNLFSESAGDGRPVGVTGFYLNYCRNLGQHTQRCLKERFVTTGRREVNLEESMAALGRALLPRWGRRPFHYRRYHYLVRDTSELLRDPNLSVVFAHLPVPHLPGIYLPHLKETTPDLPAFSHDEEKAQYESNLQLADETLGKLLTLIEADPRPTHLIVTSDHSVHPWRWLPPHTPEDQIDRRIPFWVRPWRAGSAQLKEPFNTVLMKDLALALGRGEMESGDEIAQWIRRRGAELPAAPTNSKEDCGKEARKLAREPHAH